MCNASEIVVFCHDNRGVLHFPLFFIVFVDVHIRVVFVVCVKIVTHRYTGLQESPHVMMYK